MRGHMSPSLPVISLIFRPSGRELLLFMAFFVDILYAGMSEKRSQQVLWMVASYWTPLKYEGMISCVCLGFEIPHVEYFMAV